MYYLITATSDTNRPPIVYALATNSTWYGWAKSAHSACTNHSRTFPSKQPNFATFFADCVANNPSYIFHYVTVEPIEDLPVKFPELFI